MRCSDPEPSPAGHAASGARDRGGYNRRCRGTALHQAIKNSCGDARVVPMYIGLKGFRNCGALLLSIHVGSQRGNLCVS